MRLSHDGCLYSIGADFCDYLDPTVPIDAWPALLSYIASLWDPSLIDCSLLNLSASIGCTDAIRSAAASAGFVLEESSGDATSVVQLCDTWESYLAALPAHSRKELRRKLRKAQSEGGARFNVCTTPQESVAALRQCLGWMQAGSGDKVESVRDYLGPFLLELAETLLRERRLQLLTLSVLDRPACHLIELPTTAGPCLYNLGHDAAMSQWSPGVVAVAMSISRAIEGGFGRYDLLRGRGRFKSEFGAEERALGQLILRRPVVVQNS